MMSSYDHAPPHLDISQKSQPWKGFPKRRVPVCDTKAMNDDKAIFELEQALERIQQPNVSTKVREPVAYTNACVRQAAADAVPLRQRPTQQHISDGTFSIIEAMCKHRKQVLSHPANQRRLRMMRVFAILRFKTR